MDSFAAVIVLLRYNICTSLWGMLATRCKYVGHNNQYNRPFPFLQTLIIFIRGEFYTVLVILKYVIGYFNQ